MRLWRCAIQVMGVIRVVDYLIWRDLEPVCGQELFFQYAILGDCNTARWRTDNTIFSECPEGFGRYIFEFCSDAGARRPELTQCVTVKVIGSKMPVGYAA